ncbi:MAG: leucine-rich repeat protein [Clostridiales bacterium]|nr:leucine-rich repeat protein [Clostridiales bacterium]
MESNHSVRMLIGFGNINVKLKRDNDDKEYPYVLGAHGYCVISINDKDKFSSKFGKNTSIESNKIRKSTIGIIKQLCSKSLSEYYKTNDLPCSHIQSHIDEISSYLFNKIKGSDELDSLGLKVDDFVLENISVQEQNDVSDYIVVDENRNNLFKVIVAIVLSLVVICVSTIIVITTLNNKKEVTSESTTIIETEETTQGAQIEYGKQVDSGSIKLRYDYDGWSVYECDKKATNINIPDTIEGVAVYKVENGTFKDCLNLDSVQLPNGLKYISDEAFYNCQSLKEIVIPDSVRLIGDSAFSNCTKLKNVVIPNSVTSIGDFAFDTCSNLLSISIPQSVTSIGFRVVGNCNKLSSISVAPENTVYFEKGNCIVEKASKTIIAGCNASVIPNDGSAIIIGDSAFEMCHDFVDVIIPSGIEVIEHFAFGNCDNLKSFYISETVRQIGDEIFCGSNALEVITVDSNNNTYHSVGNCVIETESKTLVIGCKTSIIPNDGSVTKIGYMAFCRCKELISIVIPEGVTTIGNQAFVGCSNMTSIEIPSSVTEIQHYAFSSDNSLSDIYYKGTREQWNKIKMDRNDTSLNGVNIHYLDE